MAKEVLTTKQVEEILGFNTKSMPQDQKDFVTGLAGAFASVINKALDGIISTDELKEALKSKDGATLDSLSETQADIVKQLTAATNYLEKLKKNGLGMSFASKYNERFDEMYDSPQFQEFLNGKEKSTSTFAFKDVSLTNDYTGSALLTQPSNHVVTPPNIKKYHIRDFATVLPGDPEYPVFGYQQIEHVDKNARYVTENGRLPESMLKITERSAEVARVGHHFRLSKRALKCRNYLRGYVMTCLLLGVRDAEDFAILFGDGTGDNLKGITTYEQARPVEAIVSENIVVGEAGCVSAISQSGNGVVVELAKAHDYLLEGMRITFANATKNTVLNGTFDVIKKNDRQLFLEGVKLTNTEEADVAADVTTLTFKVNHGAFKSIESPNSMDALESAVCVMTYGQFVPSVLLLNPITINSIRTEKATDGNRLKVVEGADGQLKVGHLTAIPYTGIPAGRYFLGDMNTGAQIIDYTPLTLEWADDVETKLKNQVVLIAQSEEIVPVFCPAAFSYGNINALKAAIAKD